MRILSIILFSCLMLLACQSDTTADYSELDLMSYGVPLTIMAPDSAKIEKEDWIAQQSVAIVKGDYDIVVWSAPATTTDLATAKANKLAEVKSGRIFSKIIKEDSDGFIYETKLDSSTLYYNFYHVRIQGDKEYAFQSGLRGNFTMEQAEQMYQAVRPIVK